MEQCGVSEHFHGTCRFLFEFSCLSDGGGVVAIGDGYIHGYHGFEIGIAEPAYKYRYDGYGKYGS